MTNFRKQFFPVDSDIKALLITGALTHLLFVSLAFIAGKLEIFPRYLLSNGVLAGDATTYIEKCTTLSRSLWNGEFGFLFTAGEQIHLRLFSLSYALLSPLVGNNIFAFELVNLPLLLGILYFIYRVGELCFSRKVRLVAALVVNFLPSFQLHATQPLRDSLFIFLFLAFFLILGLLLAKPLNLAPAVKILFLSTFCFLLLWLVRNGMFPVYLAVTSLTLPLLLLAKRGEWRNYRFNVILLLLLIGFILLTPKTFADFTPEKQFYSAEMYEKIERFKGDLREAGQPKYLAYVNAFRYEFNSVYSDAGSNIDRDLYLASPTELFLYLPRAALIGCFAPFPDLWFSEGKSFGKAGRIMAGGETFFIYLLALFALIAVCRNYRSAYVWLKVLSIGVGTTALGLIVTNLGAIYRMRYAFWFLLILLGTEGVVYTLQRIKASNPITGFKE